MFGLKLVGPARPLAPGPVAKLGALPPDYATVMTTWGPGRAYGELDFPDPTAPDGDFALLQDRFALHAPHVRAMGRWTSLSADDLARSLVLARRSDSAVLVWTREKLCWLHADGRDVHGGAFSRLLQYYSTGHNEKLPATYTTEAVPRSKQVASSASAAASSPAVIAA